MTILRRPMQAPGSNAMKDRKCSDLDGRPRHREEPLLPSPFQSSEQAPVPAMPGWGSQSGRNISNTVSTDV